MRHSEICLLDCPATLTHWIEAPSFNPRVARLGAQPWSNLSLTTLTQSKGGKDLADAILRTAWRQSSEQLFLSLMMTNYQFILKGSILRSLGFSGIGPITLRACCLAISPQTSVASFPSTQPYDDGISAPSETMSVEAIHILLLSWPVSFDLWISEIHMWPSPAVYSSLIIPSLLFCSQL
jgi:hypothetical protein